MTTGEDENSRTLFVGNVCVEKVTEEMLWELFLQAGPLEKVKIPPGKSFGFVTFKHACSVPYTIDLMGGTKLFGRELRLQSRTGSSRDMQRQNSINSESPNLTGFSRSSSVPNASVDSLNPMVGMDNMGASPACANVNSMSPYFMQGPPSLLNFPMSLPPLHMGNFNNSPQNSPCHTPDISDQRPNYRDRSNSRDQRGNRDDKRRSERYGDRDDHRDRRDGRDDGRGYRHSRDNRDKRNGDRNDDNRSWRDDGDSMNQKRDRMSNALSSQKNLNPQQRHMQPSPSRKPWQQQGRRY